jgi:hypothetical protein
MIHMAIKPVAEEKAPPPRTFALNHRCGSDPPPSLGNNHAQIDEKH